MSPEAFQHCPKCGSGKILTGEIVGTEAPAKCGSCGWGGSRHELVTAVLGGTADAILENPDLSLDIAQSVSREYMIQLSKMAAREMGVAMIEAGVVGRRQPKELARLIRAACFGAHRATLEEIENIQKEIQDERRGNDN